MDRSKHYTISWCIAAVLVWRYCARVWLIPLAESKNTDHELPIRNTTSDGRGSVLFVHNRKIALMQGMWALTGPIRGYSAVQAKGNCISLEQKYNIFTEDYKKGHLCWWGRVITGKYLSLREYASEINIELPIIDSNVQYCEDQLFWHGSLTCAGSDILTAVTMTGTVLWHMIPRSQRWEFHHWFEK